MNKIIYFLLLISFTGISQSSEELFDLGMTFHQSNPDKAIQYYSETIEQAPYFVDAYFNRGLLYFQDESYGQAKVDFETAVEISPKDAEAYENLAKTLFVMNIFDQSKLHFDNAIKLNPYSSDLLLFRAQCSANVGDYEGANQDFINAINVNKKNVDALRSYADFLAQQHEDEKAITYYVKVIEINQKDAYTYNNLGLVHWKIESYSKAIRDFTKAIKIEENAQFYINRGLLYMQEKDYEAALHDFMDAIQISPSNLSGYNCLGFVFLKKKEYERAFTYFEFGINDEDNTMEAIKGHTEACMEIRYYQKAKKNLQKLLIMNPNDSLAQSQFSVCESQILKGKSRD